MENTFGIPIIPDNDRERLEKLYSYNVIDRYDEDGIFKHVAAMAAKIFKVPIALVSLVDKEHVIFKGNVGMEGTDIVSRGASLCSLAVLNDGVTVFENAKEEPCLLSNPLVAGDFGLKFYAGAPIRTPDGFNIGTVCVVDKKVREFTEEDQRLLEGLATAVMTELEDRQLAGE
ncbi:GAF domain-containing protein [Cesiribacter sp. SM1]|uniref:GAF domain-containing protein n=1 Tax=Cesiribacter sp. SM1 TaxID=2861196 RepID=UPI001CD5728A|nr:GAF domain-containing protein [Cesiribacter sp. SM1]